MSNFGNSGLAGIQINNNKCYKCKHLFKDGQSCKAFPNGIPIKILLGDTSHTKPYDGDNGIQYEVNKEVENYEQKNS